MEKEYRQMTNTLSIEFKDGIEIVTLNRPPVNAVNHEMMVELEQTFLSYDDRPEVKAVVLAAAGTRAFCGGIDLKEVNASGLGTAKVKDQVNPGWQWRQTQRAIRHSAVPVVCAVEAPAIGAGIGLVGIVDLIVASTNARFALTEINVGLLGGASKALHLVGPFMTRYMMYTGEMIKPEVFHRLGAVDSVVEPGEALDEAVRIAKVIASKSPLAIRMAKQSILRIETDLMEEQYRTEWDYTNRLRQFEDSQEALDSYLEKREPQWKLK